MFHPTRLQRNNKISSKNKIAIVCYSHYDATLGLGKYLCNLYPDLHVDFIFLLCQAKSITVENIDLSGYTFKEGFINSGVLRKALGENIYDYLGPEVGLQAFIFRSIKMADWKNYRLLWQLKRSIEKAEYDLIHFVGNNPWIILLNAVFRNMPKVHTLHEPHPFVPLNRYRLLRHRTSINLLLATNSKIIVPSSISLERLKEHFDPANHKIRKIPFGNFEIYRTYLENTIPKEDHLLLYYGSITEYKGVPDLLEAMKEVVKKLPNLKLIVAGNGPLNYDISDLPKNTEVINRYLSNREIAELNAKATAVICPYRGASQSGVVMTSFAFGNPVIATRVGAFPEMIKHRITGYLVEPGDIEAISTGILQVFSDPELIHTMRQNILEDDVNSDKSWIDIANNHYSIYRELMTQSHVSAQY